MATDEEYLDNLLKSMTQGDASSKSMDDIVKPMTVEEKKTEDVFSFNSDDLADMLDKIEKTENAQPVIEEIQDETPPGSVDTPVFQDLEQSELSKEWDDVITETVKPAADKDVTDYIDNMDHVEDDLLEINELLKKADQNEYIEPDNEDMMDLLNNLQGNFINTESEKAQGIPEDALGVAGMGEEEQSPDQAGGAKRRNPFEFWKKKKKKQEAGEEAVQEEESISLESEGESSPGRRKRFFGKRKKKQNEPEVETEENQTLEETDVTEKEVSAFMEEFEEVPSAEENLTQDFSLEKQEAQEIEQKDSSKAKKAFTEKKKSIFTKIFEYLAQDDEEDVPGDENAEILEELAREDQKAAKAEEKKKKKAEKKEKAKKEEPAQKAADEKKKAKKLAREEKKRERKEKAAAEKPVKVLGKKGLTVLVAFGVSVIAAVFALSTFLPEYVDKENAKTAFYVGDYEQVYKLLYGKNLNANEQLLFDRAKVVLMMERKLDSYENNKALGRSLEALDALIQGVARYGKLEQADATGAREEVDAIYDQICAILASEYGVSPEEALEIYSFESEDYTRTLQSLIAGEGFVQKQEDAPSQKEGRKESLPKDILPEEEEMLETLEQL